MSTKRKRAVLSIKDKQIIISRLDREKGTNLPQEFGFSKQQISDIRKNKVYDKLRIHSDNRESNSQPEFREDNIAESMVEMLEHVQQLDNEEMPNARDVEDWLNLESIPARASSMRFPEPFQLRSTDN